MSRVTILRLVAFLGFLSLVTPARAGEKLGLEGRFLDAESIAGLFNLEVPGGGVLVEHVVEGSPAARAGLRGGDVDAKILGDDVVLGGDIIVQLEVHNVCSGACLEGAATELRRFTWIGVTYLRRGKLERAVIDLMDKAVEPVEEPASEIPWR